MNYEKEVRTPINVFQRLSEEVEIGIWSNPQIFK